MHLSLLDSHADGAAGSVISLRGKDLDIELAEVETVGLPGVEVVGGCDYTAAGWVLTDRDILVEGGGTLDRGLVDLGVLVDVVVSSVAGDGAEERSGAVFLIPVLHDVVLDERVGGPAVDGERHHAAAGGEAATVVDGSVNRSLSVPVLVDLGQKELCHALEKPP